MATRARRCVCAAGTASPSSCSSGSSGRCSGRWRSCRRRCAAPAGTAPPAGTGRRRAAPGSGRTKGTRTVRRRRRPARQGRERTPAELADDATGSFDPDGEPAGEPVPDDAARVPPGPYDEADAPDDGVPRVDLGALRVPVLDGVEVRVDVDEAGQVVSATLVDGRSALQLGAFAAPKSAGIWAEVRAEIAAALRESGGSAREATGAYGVELDARVPTDQRGVLAPARFVGIDGPRWFLRALITGAAAVEPAATGLLDHALRAVVVVRGEEAMPLREPLPLKLPKEALDAAAGEAAAGEAGGSPPDP